MHNGEVSALNLVALGVIGIYVWRSFENTKARPGYIVSMREEFPAVEREAMIDHA